MYNKLVLLALVNFVSCSRVVFRDDFNSWNEHDFDIAVTASGGGVSQKMYSYLISSCRALFKSFLFY